MAKYVDPQTTYTSANAMSTIEEVRAVGGAPMGGDGAELRSAMAVDIVGLT